MILEFILKPMDMVLSYSVTLLPDVSALLLVIQGLDLTVSFMLSKSIRI